MRKNTLARIARVELAPPRYLAAPAAGIDISASGIKLAVIEEKLHGLELVAFGEERLAPGVIIGGEISNPQVVADAIRTLTRKHRIRFANIALSESRSYLFEAEAPGANLSEWRTSVEQHLDEYVPLPSTEVAFDIAPVKIENAKAQVVGVGYARRVIEESLRMLDEAGIAARAIESETFSVARALLPYGDTETVLIIDIGRTTTKLSVVGSGIPRFATTLDIGGHALTLAVQKHFSVTEEEAKRVKAEKGLVAGAGNEEYIAAMLSTVSVIRDEIVRRLDYWQTHAVAGGLHEPVTRVVLAGGNATVRGLPEYLETALKLPVELGEVFTNLASRDVWLPPIDYLESLAYATAIGLALREHTP
ncbi:MAG: Type pilus assembly protein PilM [Parcubacteria group bacterium]|nr:Type pilus assembly protein PilM [Parcubacteria group bacterium]